VHINGGTIRATTNQTDPLGFFQSLGAIELDAAGLSAGTATQTLSGIISGTGTVEITGSAQSIILAGTLSPGDTAGAAGVLTFQNTTGVTLAAGAKFAVDLKALDDNDRLVASNGTIAFQGDLVVRIAPALVKTLKIGDEFTIAQAVTGGAGSIVSQFANVFHENGADWLWVGKNSAYGAVKFEVSVRDGSPATGRIVVLRAAAITPEPSTYALCGSALLGALLLLRRRRKAKP
jgi:hypothetical protein